MREIRLQEARKQFGKNDLIWTPWGWVDNPAESYADGKILWYETDSHGGFWVDPELNESIPFNERAETCWCGGVYGWYEEDCCWVKVVRAFPDYFSEDMKKQAGVEKAKVTKIR